MIDKRNVSIVDILLLVTVVLFLFELVFLNTGLVLFIPLCGVLIYFGKKQYYRPRGKVMFWTGTIFIIITVLNTMAFKFLLLVVVIYLVIKWYKSKQQPDYYKPTFTKESTVDEGLHEQKLIFANNWFGGQQTRKHPYEWKDVNIQTGIGDTIVDLNYTVIPKSEPVIIIRNVIGNVEVHVPYDVEVSINHSVMFGSIQIFDHVETNVWNKVLYLQTSNYQESKQKVKIFTSIVCGNVEVKRG